MALYEREVAVRLVLVANNSSLILYQQRHRPL